METADFQMLPEIVSVCVGAVSSVSIRRKLAEDLPTGMKAFALATVIKALRLGVDTCTLPAESLENRNAASPRGASLPLTGALLP